MQQMNTKTINITILGAGISGLATAYWLDKDGFNVTVIEEQGDVGGSMDTTFENGFLIDFGPNSGLETSPLIAQIAEDVGLKEDMIYANEEGDKRYILKNDDLHALPLNPFAFLKTKLFSPKAKLRLIAEPFIKKSKDGYYQSISQFVKRRLGQEFLDYAIDPFVSGVFAGDPDALSVKSAFPKLYRLEEIYGGLIKGMILGAKERKERSEQSKQNARMFSFKKGMQSFPKSIAKNLKGNILLNCHVEKVIQEEDKFKILYSQGDKKDEMKADIVLSTIPAYKTVSLFSEFDIEIKKHFNTIYYPPVKVLYLGFRKECIGRDLDGFGFLIPKKENKPFLGAIWSSVIFPDRANNDMAAFTLFIGGSRSPGLFDNETPELVEGVIMEFKRIMKIKEDPILIKERLWSKAIPQYNIGYIEHERYFEKFEMMNPGIFLSGNFRGGISVGDCIINSELTYKRIREYIESN